MQSENEKKNYFYFYQFYYQLLASIRNNIALYKSCVYCKHKTNLIRRSVYFREQYYTFRNQLRALV